MSEWGSHRAVEARLQRLWQQGWLLQPGAADEFPLRIPLRHPSGAVLADRFEEARKWIAGLTRAADAHGYELEWKAIRHRQLGSQRLPVAARIPDLDSALKMIGRLGEWRRYNRLAGQILERFPGLGEWLHAHPHLLLKHRRDWPRLLDFITWLRAHPRPGIYLRQVELEGIDTKFIETHRRLLVTLLDQVLEGEAVDPEATGARNFARRYGFREKPVLIRFRLLDRVLEIAGMRDLAVTVEDFSGLHLPIQRVFITENEINGLAFPEVPGGLVIFGLGYGLKILGEIEWLGRVPVYYWGDLDTHGFAMLDQLRSHFPSARSLLMDEATLLAHRSLWGTEPKPTRRELTRLDEQEAELYDRLRRDHYQASVRLEQERIGFRWVKKAVSQQTTGYKPVA